MPRRTQASAPADWRCAHCQAVNRAAITCCEGCGEPRHGTRDPLAQVVPAPEAEATAALAELRRLLARVGTLPAPAENPAHTETLEQSVAKGAASPDPRVQAYLKACQARRG